MTDGNVTALVRPFPGDDVSFLSGGGEMGALMRAHDWSRSPLGAPSGWPAALKTTVGTSLDCAFPICIWWGRELGLLYNDEYLSILGADKHPRALGAPGREVWAEIWDTIGPMLAQVMENGEATRSRDLPLILERHGIAEEGYFSFSYSPIVDADGRVGGVFCPVLETSDKVIGERRLRTLRDLAAECKGAQSEEAVFAAAARVFDQNPYDIPFAMIYVVEPGRGSAELAAAAGIAANAPIARRTVVFGRPDPWALEKAAVAREAIAVGALPEGRPKGAWSRPPDRALVLPILLPGEEAPRALVVAAVNPHRRLDESHRTFFNLIATQIASALADARALEAEKKRAEALAELDRAKTAFFSNVSHEFRTPLTLLMGPMEDILAARKESLRSDHRVLLELAHRNGLRLLKLVNTLLDFSRVEAGRIEASYQPTDLSALTADLAANFRSACERAGLDLVIDCPPLEEPVFVDSDMWEKIVLNLLSNAFKFTFRGGIEVTVRRADEIRLPSSPREGGGLHPPYGAHAALTVRDTGAGIPANELTRIFERFRRIEGQKSRSHEGSGIGLALVQELVKLHGGEISAASDGEGRGAAFTVRIPLGKDHLPKERIGAARGRASTAVRAEAFVEEALRWLPETSSPAAAGEVSAEPTEGGGAQCPNSHAPSGPRLTARPTSPAHAGEEKQARILFADDNADMRDYVRRLLGDRWRVDVTADGEAALAAVRRDPPDLLLTDAMMPGLDGFALLNAVRGDAALADLPVIILSARAGEEAKIEGLEAGADDYIVKPFAAKELEARVAAALELARVRRESVERIRESDARERREKERYETLNWLAQTVAGDLDLERIVQAATDAATALSGAKFGAFFYNVTDAAGERYLLYTLSGAAREDFEKFGMPRNTAVFGPTFAGETTIRSDDIRKDRRYGRSAPHHGMPKGHLPVVSYLAVPVKSRSGEVIGGLFLGHPEPGVFTEESEAIVEGVAAHAAIAIDNARLLQTSQREVDVRRKAQDALAKSEESLGLALDGASAGAWDHDLKTREFMWSDRHFELLGYAPGSIAPTFEAWASCLHADDLASALAEFQRAKAERNSFRAVYRILRADDGEARWIEDSGRYFYGPDGAAVRCAGVIIDITEGKRAEAAEREVKRALASELAATQVLAETSTRLIGEEKIETLYERILDAAVAIMSSDFASLQRLCPERGGSGELKLLGQRGFTKEAAQHFEWVRPASESACGRVLASAERCIIRDVETCGWDPDGEDLAAHRQTGIRAVQTTPLKTRAGAVVGMISTHWREPCEPDESDLRLFDVLARQAADLLERSSAEAALRASQARFSAIVAQAAAGIAQTDATGRFILVNDRYCGIVGRRHDELLQMRMQDITHPDDLPANAEQFRRLVEGGPDFVIEKRYIRKDGSIVWVRNSVGAVRAPDGRVESLLAVVTDITDARRADEALRGSERRQRLLADIGELTLREDSVERRVEAIAARVAAELGVSRCGLARVDLDRGFVSTVAEWRGGLAPLSGRYPLSQYAAHMMEDGLAGRPTVASDLAADARTSDRYAAIWKPIGVRAHINTPLRRERRWVGNFWVSTDEARDWTPDEVALVSAAAERVWAFVEQARLSSEAQRLAAIVASSDDAIVSKDLNGVVQTWNAGAERLFGYSAEEMVGKAISTLIPEERLDEEPQILARIGAGESIDHYETVRRRKDGSLIDVSLTVSPIRDAEGRIIGASKIARDITERKAAEAALVESEARFREAADSAPSPMWMTNAQGKVEFANRRFEEFAGLAAPELAGDVLQSLVHPDDMPWVAEEREAAWKDGHRPYTFEARFRRADGRWSWMEVNSRPRVDPHGGFHGYVGLAVDRTDERAAQIALRESEERYRSIYATAGASIWEEDFTAVKKALDKLKAEGVTDFARYFDEHPDFVDRAISMVNLTGVNDATIELFGAPDRASLLQSLDRIFLPETRATFVGELLTIAEGRQYFTGEAPLKTFDGRRIDVLVSIAFPRTGSFACVPVVLLDITKRKATEEALREREAIVRAIATLGDIIRNAAGAGALMDGAAAMIGAHFGADRCAFVEFDETRDQWSVRREWRASADDAPIVGNFQVSAYPPLVLEALRSGDAVAVSDAASDPRTAEYYSTVYEPFGMRAFLGIPLLRDGQWVFGVGVHAKQPREWTADQAALLRALSERVWIAVERFRLDAILRESEERFRALADNIAAMCWIADAEGKVFWRNRRWHDYFGVKPEEIDAWDFRAAHDPEILPEVLQRVDASLASGEPFEMEFPLKGADGVFRPFLTRIEPLRDARGRVWRWFGANTDISEQHRYQQHLKLMIEELNHRVKNTLAIVMAVARQTFRSEEPSAAQRAFEGRLQALAAAHNILSQTKWEPTDLRDVAREALKAVRSGRISLSGPPVLLSPKQAVTLAMALNELATNAAKYGPLSAPNGRIDFSWEAAGAPARLKLRWSESGGPPVLKPKRRGFGSTMLEAALAAEFGGEARLDFRREGLVFEFDAPLPQPRTEGEW